MKQSIICNSKKVWMKHLHTIERDKMKFVWMYFPNIPLIMLLGTSRRSEFVWFVGIEQTIIATCVVFYGCV